MAGTAVATTKPVNPVVALIEKRKSDIAALLPMAVPSERFIKTFKATIQRQPELLDCDPQSVLDSVTKAAQDGLIIDGREAAIVKFNSTKKVRNEHGQYVDKIVKTAQYIPMRNGLIKRIRNTGEVSTLDQTIVYQQELDEGRFEWQAGDDGFIRHNPIYDRDPGKPVLVYSIARLRDGSISRCVMRKDQVLKIKARSRSSNSGPWVTDEEEMWKKTCLRRHSKDLPMDADLRRIFDSEDYDPPATIDAKAEPVEETKTEPAKPARKKAGAAAAALNNEPPHDPKTGEILDADFSEPAAEEGSQEDQTTDPDEGNSPDDDVI
ncbi:recombinase RecT [Microvirga mediterraneensis]|uniref:Recombinase RecT n=1 Tax=Microvirga mediterraneensis TaxID=2754695 RepID=A0A838BWA1_9HYPH|nr:recombinase RecT [Microvirga mediterraneensis]MBA1159349.1 recombinase RecT [Microvirga mediterraneensis]